MKINGRKKLRTLPEQPWPAEVLSALLVSVLFATGCATPQQPTPAQPANAPAKSQALTPEKQKQIETLVEKMMVAAMAGRNAEALETCDKIIELDPANGNHYCARGNWLRGLGRKDEALAAFEKGATLTTNPIVRADCWKFEGELVAGQGKYDEAIALYTKAIASLPANQSPADVAVPWYRRAEAKAMKSDATSALADLKKAIELRPDLSREAAKSSAFKILHGNTEFKDLIKNPATNQQAERTTVDFRQTDEWKALNRLVGQWETLETVTIPKPREGRGSATTTWTLGDRYLETRAKSGLDDCEWMSLCTYDEKRRTMRSWIFSSLWQPGVSSIQWDEKTQTFNIKGENAGPTTFTATERLIDNDHREWSCMIKDADNKVIFQATSKITRVKK